MELIKETTTATALLSAPADALRAAKSELAQAEGARAAAEAAREAMLLELGESFAILLTEDTWPA